MFGLALAGLSCSYVLAVGRSLQVRDFERGGTVQKVLYVHGTLHPRIDTKLLPARTRTTSFTVELAGYEVKATPLAGVDLDPDAAVQLLYDEVRPLLAATSHLKRTPIILTDANPSWLDTSDPDQHVHSRPVGIAFVQAFIVASPTTTADVEQRVARATQDAV
jgi:hypothetical protein